MINPNIHVQKCEQLDAAIVEIAVLKQQLAVAREEIDRWKRLYREDARKPGDQP